VQTSAKVIPVQIRSDVSDLDDFTNLVGFPYPKAHLCQNFHEDSISFLETRAKL